MKHCLTASGRGRLLIRVIGGCVLFPTLSLAQVVWDNGNGNNRWGTANNWNPNGVPGAGSNVQFNATDDNATVSNIQLRGDWSANSLTFNNVNDNFSIINGTGSRTLTLTSGDITRTAGSSNTQGITATTLALGGDAAMNIAGTGTFTISSAIIDSGGSRSLTKSGAGELILSGTNTYSNSTTISAGTLTLANSSALGTGGSLTLSGGTLKLSTATIGITNLNVTADSTIDFGGAAATLTVANFTVSAGVTLNIINWVNASDYFFATNWLDGGAGAGVYDTGGVTPMNQVVFASFSANDTQWKSYGGHEITPVPEPRLYGAIILALATGLILCRRPPRRAA